MWFGKLPTSTGESPYYLEMKKGYNKYMEEDHSTPWLLPLQLSLSLHSLAHTHVLSHIFLSNIRLLYRHFIVNMERPIALKHATICGINGATTCLVVRYCH
jgi:hypothetical protein